MTRRLLTARTGLVAVLVLLPELPWSFVEASRLPAERWRAMIVSLPSGTPLEVRLPDGTRVTGRLAEATDQGFTLTGESAADARTFSYQDPKMVTKVNNWKPGKKLLIVNSRVSRSRVHACGDVSALTDSWLGRSQECRGIGAVQTASSPSGGNLQRRGRAVLNARLSQDAST